MTNSIEYTELNNTVLFSLNFAEVIMDNKEVCSKVGNIYWVSEERSFLIVGRGKMNSEYMLDCAIVVGASTDQPSVLQLKFDAVYIEDCGVTISINQSSVSDFTDNNTEMVNHFFFFWTLLNTSLSAVV